MKLIITESQYKKLTFDDIVKEAEKYNSKTEFRNGNVTAYNLAIKLGVLSELFPERKQREPKWNYETISQEAKKYKGRRDFSVNNPTAYGYARKLNILDDLFGEKLHKFWTYDELKKESSKYKTRSEFLKGSPKAYYSSYEYGLLDDFFPKLADDVNVKQKLFDNPIFSVRKIKDSTTGKEYLGGEVRWINDTGDKLIRFSMNYGPKSRFPQLMDTPNRDEIIKNKIRDYILKRNLL
jgi:hypothetical protein